MRGYSCEYCSRFTEASDGPISFFGGSRARPPDDWLAIHASDRVYHFCSYLCLGAYIQSTLRGQSAEQ